MQENDTKSVATATAITPATVAMLYFRAEQVLQVLPISRRTLSNWQRARRIRFYRIGKTVLFKRADIEAAIERFAVAAIGEVKPRKANTAPTPITATTDAPPARKRRAGRITTPAEA